MLWHFLQTLTGYTWGVLLYIFVFFVCLKVLLHFPDCKGFLAPSVTEVTRSSGLPSNCPQLSLFTRKIICRVQNQIHKIQVSTSYKQQKRSFFGLLGRAESQNNSPCILLTLTNYVKRECRTEKWSGMADTSPLSSLRHLANMDWAPELQCILSIYISYNHFFQLGGMSVNSAFKKKRLVFPGRFPPPPKKSICAFIQPCISPGVCPRYATN